MMMMMIIIMMRIIIMMIIIIIIKSFIIYRKKKRVNLNERLKPPYKIKTNDKTKVYIQLVRKKAVHKK